MDILIVEDDADNAGFLARGLAALGHVTRTAMTGTEGLQLGEAEAFDAIVLDRLLPGVDGIDLLEHWRRAGVNTPVLMLTALGGVGDRVRGLDAGADDYLVKPFALPELAARLAALARRPPIGDHPTRLDHASITLDLLRRETRREGRPVHLQPREFALLELLVRHGGQIVTRTMFLEAVWGFYFDPQTNIVESHLSRLRAKLNDGFAHDPIETVRGIGYRLRTVEPVA